MFREALSDNLNAAWLDLDVLKNDRRAMERALYFNVGVEMGRDASLISRALERAGFDIDEASPESLSFLAYALKEIGKRLTLCSSHSGGDSSA